MLYEVAAGVWVTQASLYLTTSTVIVGTNGEALVVDPAASVADLEALAADIAAHGWHVRAGFSTHPHWDHLLWAPALGDVPRWALPAAVDVATTRRAELLAEAAADLGGREGDDPGAVVDVDLFARLTPLDDRADTLPWAPVPVDLHRLGGHAPGGGALLLPAQRTLVVGDMLSDVEVPLLDLEAADPLAAYVGALEAVAVLIETETIDVLIPGHGRVADGSAARRRLSLDRAYLADLQARRPSDDPRLVPGWLLDAHRAQVSALAARAAAGGAGLLGPGRGGRGCG